MLRHQTTKITKVKKDQNFGLYGLENSKFLFCTNNSQKGGYCLNLVNFDPFGSETNLVFPTFCGKTWGRQKKPVLALNSNITLRDLAQSQDRF